WHHPEPREVLGERRVRPPDEREQPGKQEWVFRLCRLPRQAHDAITLTRGERLRCREVHTIVVKSADRRCAKVHEVGPGQRCTEDYERDESNRSLMRQVHGLCEV